MEKNNYGASEPISLAAIGAKIGAIFGKKALATGGKAVLKGGGKAALKKGTSAAVKKGTTKVAEKGLKGATKMVSKGATKLPSKTTIRTLDKTAQKSVDKLGKKATNQVKRQAKLENLKYKADVVGMKAKNVTQKGVQKVADVTGNSYEDAMDMVKGKAAQAGMAGVAAVQSRKDNEVPADPSTFISSADQKITKEEGQPEVALSSYANPQGPSAYFNKNAGPSMRKGLKYDNVGASMPLQAKSKTTSGDLKTNKPILSSLDKKNIMTKQGASANLSSLSSSNIKTKRKANAFDYLKEFNANVNIKGFKVNIGQAAQIADLLGKGAVSAGKKFGDYTKKRKVLKNTKASSVTPKNLPDSQASKQQKFSNIAQNNPTTYNYLTRGIKPGGKVTGKDASIFKQNK